MANVATTLLPVWLCLDVVLVYALCPETLPAAVATLFSSAPDAGTNGAVQAFYAVWSVLLLTIWALFSVLGGGDFHRRGLRRVVATRPSLLPARVVLALHTPAVYLALCHGTPLVVGAAAVAPDSTPLRLLVAAFVSLYSLAESAATHSHRDYPGLYICWAAVFLSDPLVRGVTLGICIHFIGSSGMAKLLVGGTASWMDGSTLKAILREYLGRSSSADRPLLPSLTTFLVAHDWLLALMSGGTIVFELLFVPAALALPQPYRQLVILASCGMHAGIAALQSFVIGVAFLPNLAAYALGLGGPLALFSAEWWAAAAVCCLSYGPTLCGTMLPEDWPCTPLCLFAWSAAQWEALFDRFVRGHTRLAFATDAVPPSALVGARVLGKWGAADAGELSALGAPPQAAGAVVLYDGWEQCVGETLAYGRVLAALRVEFGAMGGDSGQAGMAGEAWEASRLLRAVQGWLSAEGRLVEASSGARLTRAYWVRLDERKHAVAAVLATA